MALQIQNNLGFNLAGWQRMVDAVIQLVNGRHNAASAENPVTLTAAATTTVVTHPNMGLQSTVLLSPRTANAAAALATTYVSAKARGSFTLTHANNAQIDRTFDYTVTGG